MPHFRLRIHLQEFSLLPGDTRIGRGAECQLTFDDPMLSREHAALRVAGCSVTVRDLGSRNGTRVNGELITGERELLDGDRIKVGATEAVVTRVPDSRRDLATTASIRTCGACGSGYVAQAPNCPQCGARDGSTSIVARTESQRRRDFWLQLEAELLDKAMSLLRLDDAEEAVLRLVDKLDALLVRAKPIDPTNLEAALSAVVRFARMRGAGRFIGWTFDVLRRTARLPGPELFALFAATPPILLEDALPSLQVLVDETRARGGLDVRGERCLESLDELRRELVSFRAQRGIPVEPLWTPAPRPRQLSGDSIPPC
ncbi:MAG: FHA domain-containing protein [Deltaproteobacteria bacterium]|nr:FHA domain-containing protein [Deltaproteobacteria bacterium]